MKYTVGVAIKGRVYVEVDATSFEEARQKANIAVCEYDFNELEYVDWHAVNAEDEMGKFIDY